MNFSELFIRRPVATILIMFAILLFGIYAYRQLPVAELPNVDFPTLQVSASLPGASPETMASAVATPLERQFSTISGLSSMTSTSSQSSTSITLQFDLSRDLDAAALDVQSAISTAQRQLPADMPSPPSYRKVNPADMPILYLALTSPTMPLSDLDEYGETMMAQRISMVNGVAQVNVYGSQKYAVRAYLDPKLLASRGIGIDEVQQAIKSANVNLPTGILYGRYKAFTVEATGQLNEAKKYEPVIVAYRNGRPVRLGELGRVINSVENDKTAAWFVDQRALILAIQRQPGTNTVAVAQAVKDLLPQFRAKLPPSVNLQILFDRSNSIRESFTDVKFTMWLTLGLVVLVIFLFLRNVSATLIPSLSLPMSIVGTFAVMQLLGYSLNNLSLMALILSIGFVVDDAIVMLENIVRHMEMGKKPLQAALDGSREIGFTIMSMTLSLVAVFIPVLMMGGLIGRLFHEFAVSISVAILLSGFISLTLTPMLGSRILSAQSHKSHGRFYRASERFFDRMLAVYEKGLAWSLHHRGFTMFYSVLILILMGYLFKIAPKGFLPSQDNGQLFIMTEAAQGISFEDMVKHQRAVADAVRQNPNVDAFMCSAGARGSSGANGGTLMLRLKPRHERKASVDEVIQQLRPEVSKIPGIMAYMQNPPPIRIGGTMTKGQYQFILQSTDTDELYKYSNILLEKLKAAPGFLDVNTDLQITNPTVEVKIDRDKASSLGISAEQVESALYSAYGDRQVSMIYTPNNTYYVIMELDPKFQRDPDMLALLYVRSNSGKLVPLEVVAKLERTLGPLTVSHFGQLPSVTISFNLPPGVSLGQAVSTVEEISRQSMPATISTTFSGTAQAFQSSISGMQYLLLLAVLVIYIVLGILYESFIHPLTILTALPFAGFGALVTLLLFKVELNIYAFVGIVMLVGLVKKNGIMMIDFALEAQREQKRSAYDSIYEACKVRFRPIMMTTMAALMGTLPIAVGYGAGGEARQPLGLAVVGGLVFSQFLTLFVTPVFYLYMDQLQNRLRRGRKKSLPVA
ncbi:multidrug efflux RND transporter permease subunit [bacterium]|nr:multidrug efflux RND transporter permease subunit [bacterium]